METLEFQLLSAFGSPSNKRELCVSGLTMEHIHPVNSHPVIPSKGDWLLLHGEAADDYSSPLGSSCVPHHGEMGVRFCYLLTLLCVQRGGWSLDVVPESAKVTSLGGFPKTQYFSPKKQRLNPRNCLFI